jgi:tail tube protein gp19
MHGLRRFVPWSLLVVANLGIPAAPALAMDPWMYSAGHYTLELDGAPAGLLQNVEGGDMKAEVHSGGTGGPYANKRIGQLEFSPFRFQVGADMAPSFYDWITASWDAKVPRRHGAVLMVDASSQVTERREFRDAVLTETSFPAFDTSSKDPAYISVRMEPEQIRTSKGSGSVPAAPKTQRPWTVNSFRLDIAGLDCSRVQKIEPFTVKQAVKNVSLGDQRVPTKEATLLTFSDVVVTLPNAAADTWQAWTKSFLVDGKNDDSQEKIGDLILLGPDAKAEIARIHLFGLGIKSLARQTAANQPGVLVATMYCERAALEWKGGAGGVVKTR